MDVICLVMLLLGCVWSHGPWTASNLSRRCMPCAVGESNGANLVLYELLPCVHVHWSDLFFCFERDWSDLINDYLNIIEIINIVHLLTCQSLKNSKAHLHMFFLPISCSVYFALFDFNYSNKQVVLLPLSIPLPNYASHLPLAFNGFPPDHL